MGNLFHEGLLMNEVLSNEINRLEKAFEKIERDTPFLKPAVHAFKKMMISRVILKARLSPDRPDIHIPNLDYSRFTEGYPSLNNR